MTLERILGQETALESLRRRIDAWGRGVPLERALLLVGPPGTGKTTTALALESEILTRVPAWNRYAWHTEKFDCGKVSFGRVVADLEEIAGRYNWSDSEWGARKIVILDEFERFSTQEMTKLRGTLQDVSTRVLVVVTSNKPVENAGLRSRLTTVQFYELNEEASRTLVERTAHERGVALSEGAVRWVVGQGKGDARALKDLIHDVNPSLPTLTDGTPPSPRRDSGAKGGRRPKDMDLPKAVARKREGWSWSQIGKEQRELGFDLADSTVRDAVLEAAPELRKPLRERLR